MKSVKQLIDQCAGETQRARTKAFNERWPNKSVDILTQWYHGRQPKEDTLHNLNKYASRNDMLKDRESF
jgi:hypothetical protein